MSTVTMRARSMDALFGRIRPQRGLAFGAIILGALLAFEIFNYSTTDFALADLLGELSFVGIKWSTILAIAFCGIDFAGIARLFTPESGANEPNEIWYLFGAWLLAATMNAMLTWWGVSIALLEHQSLGNAVINRQTMIKIVPVFVAVLVWLIRVLIIGTFSVAGERLFSQSDRRVSPRSTYSANVSAPARTASTAASFRPAPRPASTERSYNRPDPTYQPAALSAQPPANGNSSSAMRR